MARMKIARPPDEVAVRELELFIDNDRDIYRRRLEFEKSAARKMCRGKYDAAKSPKLWRYLADEAAREYGRQFSVPGAPIFGVPDREATAVGLARDFESRVAGWRSGQYPADLAPEVAEILSSKSCKR